MTHVHEASICLKNCTCMWSIRPITSPLPSPVDLLCEGNIHFHEATTCLTIDLHSDVGQQSDDLPPDLVYIQRDLLVMQVVPAQYAFVVHTANPISKQKGETFGEVVMGMGEALVGNYPGRALSFSSAPAQKASPLLIACLIMLVRPCLVTTHSQ